MPVFWGCGRFIFRKKDVRRIVLYRRLTVAEWRIIVRKESEMGKVYDKLKRCQESVREKINFKPKVVLDWEILRKR